MKSLPSALTGRRSFRDGRAMTGLICSALAVLALLVAAGCSDDESLPSFPSPPPQTTPDWMFAVRGTGASDVYACGNNGAMYRFDGTTWTAQDLGTSRAVVSMDTDEAGTTLYAVGHGGGIWRNTGTGWSGMSSGTTQNLYGIGSLGGVMHAVGQGGVIRRLSGSSWGGAGGNMMILDENNDPVDTLLVAEDIASLVVVNNYFLGGAYIDPNYEDEDSGILGTKGMVLARNADTQLGADWILRPLVGEDPTRAPNEWVIATISDARPDSIGRNYLGTSEGWLFQLTQNDDGVNVWDKYYPSFTTDPAAGINDMWIDANRNVYLVTDEGDVWYQTYNYDLVEGTGERRRILSGRYRLTGIWGTDPSNLFIVGFMESTVIRASYDPVADVMTATEDAMPAAEKSASAPMVGDHLGRPLTR